MSVAEEVSKEQDLSYEALVNVYDRSIIAVENHPPDEDVSGKFSLALDRLLAEGLAGDLDAKSIEAPVRDALAVELEEAYVVGTGYGRVTLPFSKEHIRSEILCHGLGAHMMYPETRTVLDIGGRTGMEKPLMRLAAIYLTTRTEDGLAADPVARFHLGNGASIERIDWAGNLSQKGLRQSAGIMVNYRYDPDRIVANHEAYISEGVIAHSSKVKSLLAGRG